MCEPMTICKVCSKEYLNNKPRNKRLRCPTCHNTWRRERQLEKQREAGIVPRQVYGMLPCKTCGVEFHKEEGNHRRDCPDCVSDKRMAYYDANRDKFADRNKAKADKRVALHEWIIKYKQDGSDVWESSPDFEKIPQKSDRVTD